jgi:glycosyltransferase involved in cell wall biosynthesis
MIRAISPEIASSATSQAGPLCGAPDTSVGHPTPLALPDRPRILMPRSCRSAQFADAVGRIRALYPGAHITALGPEARRAELREAGADDVVVFEGSRFSIPHMSVRQIRHLRAGAFDAAVVPQMSDDFSHHANVYRLMLALAVPAVMLAPFAHPIRSFHRAAFARFMLWTSFLSLARRHDVPMLLLLVAAAAVKGLWHRLRSRPRPQAHGRRRLLHIISTLGVGGAQLQLAEFVDRTPIDQFDIDILVLGRADGTFSAQRFARTDIRIGYVSNWPVMSAAVLEIAARCRRERYDIVHTWLFYANFVGAAAARLAGAPFVISGVRNLSLWKRAWDTRWWYRTADVLAARIPDVLTVNATPLVADHQWWSRTRRNIPVVPNGLNPTRILGDAVGARDWLRAELGLAADATVVGTVGRLAPEKDQAVFIKAVAAVHRLKPALKAVVVGDGECGAVLKALTRELGLEEVVTFMGRRSDSRRIIAGLDVFMLTSQSEGFPNVLLESAFLGTPAISTDVAGASDVLDSVADLFPAGHPVAAAGRLAEKLNHPERARNRANAVRTRAYRLFTADQMTARWLELYNGNPTANQE